MYKQLNQALASKTNCSNELESARESIHQLQVSLLHMTVYYCC